MYAHKVLLELKSVYKIAYFNVAQNPRLSIIAIKYWIAADMNRPLLRNVNSVFCDCSRPDLEKPLIIKVSLEDTLCITTDTLSH